MSDSRVRKDPAWSERGFRKTCPPGHIQNWAKYDRAARWGRTPLFEEPVQVKCRTEPKPSYRRGGNQP